MKRFITITAAVLLPVIFIGCGQSVAVREPDIKASAEDAADSVQTDTNSSALPAEEGDADVVVSGSRAEKGALQTLSYAQCFSLSEVSGCTLIDIPQEGRYLVVPQGMEVPEEAQEDCIILQQPLNHVYMAAMDLVCAADAGSHVTFSSLEEDGWYVDAARQAMENGAMVYAGRYNKPDYEMLLNGGCDLAVENTMIYHSPQVKEKLEELGIPVLVERSSYEPDPLGRLEWIKVRRWEICAG